MSLPVKGGLPERATKSKNILHVVLVTGINTEVKIYSSANAFIVSPSKHTNQAFNTSLYIKQHLNPQILKCEHNN